MVSTSGLFARLMAMACVATGVVGCSQSPSAPASMSWDPQGAAAYLDRRMNSWMRWPATALDHGTFCVSCHTAVPYALARPNLQMALGAAFPATAERQLVDNVRERVRLWSQTASDSDRGIDPRERAESRGTEAVLNALLLAWGDAHDVQLSADTRSAFDHLWAEQHVSGDDRGAWSWAGAELEPWEGPDAEYYGAALAALAVGVAPQNYRGLPQIQEHLQLLRDYLTRDYPTQPLHHRLVLLWASTKLIGLLDVDRRQCVIEEALRAQNPDGGWSLSGLMSSSGKAGLLRDPDSDGYATGLATLVLEQTALPERRVEVQRGLTWLMQNQRGHGGLWMHGRERFWTATSLNKRRNPWRNVGRFMSDAATAYAVLALTEPAQR